MKRWSCREDQEVWAHCEAVARRIGRTPSAVARRLHKIATHPELLDTSIPRRPAPWGTALPEYAEMICELYRQGFTQQEIADRMGWSLSAIGKRLKQCGYCGIYPRGGSRDPLRRAKQRAKAMAQWEAEHGKA